MIECRLFLLGDDAVGVQPADRHLRHALALSLRETCNWVDVVPGKEFIAAQFNPLYIRPSEAIRKMKAWLSTFQEKADSSYAPVELHLDVSNDRAPDLGVLAAENNLSKEEFLEKVVQSELVIDMLGFMPGFAYVEGVDGALTGERLAVPRQRVEAGSVGFVSGQLGLYGLSGPGGWPIIGRLRETLFDPARDDPFLLREGQLIRLKLVGG